MSEPNGTAPLWLQSLQEQISENHREVIRLLDNKSDKAHCGRVEGRLDELEDRHSYLFAKVAALVSFLVGSGLLIKELML